MDRAEILPNPKESRQTADILLGVGAIAVVLIAGGVWWRWSGPSTSSAGHQYNVSQRGREFEPRSLTIRKDDVVRIINDDGDLSHHAYVATPAFSFDSGDQEPGHDVLVTFSVPGTFNVLCGIHPKMRLTVTVR